MIKNLPIVDPNASAHVRLAPSSAYRWSKCGGSAQIGLDDEGGDAAKEGTLAHARASATLLGIDLTAEFDAQVMELDDEANDKMIRGVLMYVEFCRGIPGDTEVEVKVISGYIDEHGGTIDFAADHPDWLHVVDFKYGVMPVLARNNAQLKSYLRLLREFVGRRERYFGTIVQPNVHDEPDTWEFSNADLDDWELTVIESSQDESFHAGEWCKWCPLLINCETAFAHAKQLADDEFTIVEEVTPTLIERFLQILDFEGVVGRMAELAKEKMLEYIRFGNPIEGWKAAMSIGHRAWKDPDTLPQVLAERYKERTKEPLESGLIYDPLSLKSPAQMEKVLPKDMLTDLVHRPERGVCVVPTESKLKEHIFDHFGVIENEQAVTT